MKTKIVKTDLDWIDVKNSCRTTVGKDATDNKPTEEFKQQLIISEHSPITSLRIVFLWKSMKSWISVHFARHWLGWQKWITTSRTDRTGIDRNKLPQDHPVDMKVEANAQALINVAKRRLCYMASPETREYMEDLKLTTEEVSPEIALAMVPQCIYRFGCPEFKTCGHFNRFLTYAELDDPTDIVARYKAYKAYTEMLYALEKNIKNTKEV